MVINKFRKKLVFSGVGLIAIGFIISIIGLSIARFDMSIFEYKGEYKWYRTIGYEENQPYFGIQN
ncbi:MAG: hypothetical protein ACRC41_16780 [Sarcina sp.]